MKRRPIERIVILVAGLLVVPLSVEAPLSTTVPTIGFLMLSSLAPDSLFFELFRQTLREVGYVEGQNVHLEYRWADRRAERLPDLAAELVRRKVDVIVVRETPAIYAAQQATRTIPIVMVSVADPETLGLVERLSRPGGNLTGVTGMVPELSGKLLELLTAGVPLGSRVAVLWASDARGAAHWLDEVKGAAHALAVELLPLEVHGPHEFERAFEAASQGRAGALLILPAILFAMNEQRLAALALKNRLPAMFWRRQFAEAGGSWRMGRIFHTWCDRLRCWQARFCRGRNRATCPSNGRPSSSWSSTSRPRGRWA